MLRLRVDDFPGTKPEEFSRHNLVNFKEFHRIVAEHFSSYVLGVIPAHVHESHLVWLLGHPEVCPALHGVDHREDGLLNEFPPYLTVDDIAKKLLQGLFKIYPSTPIDTYIPPHNVIDHATCQALKMLGFKMVMGGPGMDRGINLCGLELCYSEFPWEYGRSDELLVRGSIEHLARESTKRDVWLTLHWPWELNIGLHHLEKYLCELGRVIR